MKTASLATNLIACATIIGAVAAGIATGPAFAQAPRQLQDIEFKFAYDKAELGSLESTQKLLVRLETEVRKECKAKILSSREPTLIRTCVTKIMQSSVPKFGSAILANSYDLRAAG